uniref:RNase H type-1 domain-containing protein n=1 Tax=Populus trichocarpa TaxID=3694 RepID=B9HBU9_POPTR
MKSQWNISLFIVKTTRKFGLDSWNGGFYPGVVQVVYQRKVNQWLKWNVDGSSTRKPSDPGIDGVLRDHKGIVQCMNRSIPVGIKDSNEAEPIAVIKALELSSTREECIGKRIIIESDSSIVINRIIKEYNRPWKFHVLFILASRFSSGLRLVTYICYDHHRDFHVFGFFKVQVDILISLISEKK